MGLFVAERVRLVKLSEDEIALLERLMNRVVPKNESVGELVSSIREALKVARKRG